MPAIPASGPISLQDFATEFGGTVPHSLSEYYRDGGNVPSNNTNVPTSGVFSFSNMRGAINAIIQTLSNTTNVDLSTVFGSDWSSTVPKEVIIPSGVTIGGTGSSDALTAPSGMGGTLTITNAGSVIGFGGAASGAGGNAVRIASSGITVANSGLIAGGGGGGGTGGAGGQGGSGWGDAGFDNGQSYCGNSCITCPQPIGSACGGSYLSVYFSRICGSCQMGDKTSTLCQYHCYSSRSGGAGGSGGSGGVGQGYSQSTGTGGAGSAGGSGSGGTYGSGAGGTGGTGGNGSAYGVAGSSGSSGSSGANGYASNGSAGSAGASGGAAGAAVIFTTAYTLNNTGTVSGAA